MHSHASLQSIMFAASLMLSCVTAHGAARIGADFNGDGVDDLVVPIPYESIGQHDYAGAVQVIYGHSPNGLDAQGSQFWHQNSLGVPGVVRKRAYFGLHCAVGNFNGDAFDDLAIYAGKTFQLQPYNMVIVLYGSSAGLTTAGVQALTALNLGLGDEGLNSTSWNRSMFARELQAGDFDGDGCDELLIGQFYCTTRHIDDDGLTFAIVPGSLQGLQTSAASLFSRTNPTALTPTPSPFQIELETADFNGDGYDDFALGLPGDNSVGLGEVRVYFGSASGLRVAGMQLWHQDRAGIADTREDGDQFGSAVAAGDFDHDGRDDLAIGVPYESFEVPLVAQTIGWAGLVHVLYGSSSGLTATGSQVFSQLPDTVHSEAGHIDQFGKALSTGDFDGDGICDLVVGVPNDTNIIAPGVEHGGGGIHVFFGTADGLFTDGAQYWQRETPGVIGAGSDCWGFGDVLSSGDYNGDGRTDLALGLPALVLNGHSSEGAVHVMYGASDGLTAIGDQLWHQNVAGIASVAENRDLFGIYLPQ